MRGIFVLVLLLAMALPARAAEEPSGRWEEIDELLAEDEAWMQPDPAQRDPLERLNRATHALNERFIDWVADPFNRVYRFAVPAPARHSVARFFANLRAPVILANDLLQLTPHDAGRTGARFLINTTVGVVGLFDPARAVGLPGHDNDFGATLAVYGAPSGPYLVVPVLGPSSARDVVGETVDGFLRPDAWVLGVGTRALLTTGSGVAVYDLQQERLEALRKTSVDFYAALRGAFLLDRDASIRARIRRIWWRRLLEGDSEG